MPTRTAISASCSRRRAGRPRRKTPTAWRSAWIPATSTRTTTWASCSRTRGATTEAVAVLPQGRRRCSPRIQRPGSCWPWRICASGQHGEGRRALQGMARTGAQQPRFRGTCSRLVPGEGVPARASDAYRRVGVRHLRAGLRHQARAALRTARRRWWRRCWRTPGSRPRRASTCWTRVRDGLVRTAHRSLRASIDWGRPVGRHAARRRGPARSTMTSSRAS